MAATGALLTGMHLAIYTFFWFPCGTACLKLCILVVASNVFGVPDSTVVRLQSQQASV